MLIGEMEDLWCLWCLPAVLHNAPGTKNSISKIDFSLVLRAQVCLINLCWQSRGFPEFWSSAVWVQVVNNLVLRVRVQVRS